MSKPAEAGSKQRYSAATNCVPRHAALCLRDRRNRQNSTARADPLRACAPPREIFPGSDVRLSRPLAQIVRDVLLLASAVRYVTTN